MGPKPRVMAIGVGEAVAGLLVEALEGTAEFVGWEAGAEDGLERLRRERPGVVLLLVDGHPPDWLRDLAREVASAGATPVAVASTREPERVFAALQAGFRELVSLDGHAATLRRAVAEAARGRPAHRAAQVVAVVGARPGVGATTVAVHLAVEWARSGRRILVLDLLPPSPGLAASPSWAPPDPCLLAGPASSLPPSPARGEEDALLASVEQDPSGVYVLPCPGRTHSLDGPAAAGLEPSRATDVPALIAGLEVHFDGVLVDGLYGVDAASLAAIERADLLLLVTDPAPPALRRAQLWAHLLRERLPPERLHVVLNRFRAGAGPDPRSVAELLGVPAASVTPVAHDGDVPPARRSPNNRMPALRDPASSAMARDLTQLGRWLRERTGPWPGEARAPSQG